MTPASVNPRGAMKHVMLVALGAGPVAVDTLAACSGAPENYARVLVCRLQRSGKARPAGLGFRRRSTGPAPMLWELVP